jgi:hypothetical protein
MDKPKPRRWFRFSLRTMFVLVTVFCVWLGYQLNWIRQRRDAIRSDIILSIGTDETRPPGLLWIFGEQGHSQISSFRTDEVEINRLEELFPEAQIFVPFDREAPDPTSIHDNP